MSDHDQAPPPNHREQSEVHSADDIDDLFDYDVGLDEVLNSISTESNRAGGDAIKESTTAGSGPSLGLDEEVKVSRKRQPIAKLDESRLLSKHGIPKLRRTAKSKLKFKGKGHEFSDMARLLNFYQLWLDDLYPRAKFTDGLAMIEKLGHSKRIQVMRREWIEEDKPIVNGSNTTIEPTTNGIEGDRIDSIPPGLATAETGSTLDTDH
ncbi:hypothetical protein VTN77DRAFT_8525 [Rasamsonia byssochlamydoides]|uniref:uncharacterized protein n=1 Tax=Rasamsonia byssochlamydoides TaxID=89139 RepID=UPI00374399E6